jgi:hypothetical protein
MTDEDRQLLREKLTKQLMIETYMKHDTTKLNPVAVLWRLGAGGTSQLRRSGGMTDDEQRVEQIRMLFADAVERGDTDAQEILRAELLNSGILPIEEAIQLRVRFAVGLGTFENRRQSHQGHSDGSPAALRWPDTRRSTR